MLRKQNNSGPEGPLLTVFGEIYRNNKKFACGKKITMGDTYYLVF